MYMRKEIIDTSKYPIKKRNPRSLGKICWIKVRKEDGVFYKENMWFTFDSVVKDYRKFLKLQKTNPHYIKKPYKERWEVYECEFIKNKQIIFK